MPVTNFGKSQILTDKHKTRLRILWRVFLSVSFWSTTILLGTWALTGWSKESFFIVLFVAILFKILIETLNIRFFETKKQRKRDDIFINEVLKTINFLEKDFGMRIRSHISWMDPDDTLRIKYSCNMEGDPDRFIELKQSEGCMGKTWFKAVRDSEISGTFCDLTKDPDKDWDIPRREQAKIKDDLKWVYTLPIIISSNDEAHLLALFTVDGNEILVTSEDVQKIYDFTKALSNVFSVILTSMGIKQVNIEL